MGSVPTLASLHASLVDGAAEAPSPHRADTFDLLLNLITQASVHLLLRQLQDAAGMGPPPGGNGSGGPAAAAAAAAAEAEARARRGQQGRGGEADASQARAAFVWLRRYYSDRVGRCFDGSVGRGMADSFLREWAEMPSPALTTPPPPPPPRYTLPSLDGDGDGGDPPPSVQPDVSLDAPVRPLDLAERMVRIRSEVALRWRREMRLIPTEDHFHLRVVLLDRIAERGWDDGGGGGARSGGEGKEGAGGGGGGEEGGMARSLTDGTGWRDSNDRSPPPSRRRRSSGQLTDGRIPKPPEFRTNHH